MGEETFEFRKVEVGKHGTWMSLSPFHTLDEQFLSISINGNQVSASTHLTLAEVKALRKALGELMPEAAS